MAKRQKFNLRSCGSSFKQMGATSPMKTWGAAFTGARAIGAKIAQNKMRTGMAVGAVNEFDNRVSDKNDKQGTFEKAVRSIDSWTTGGIGNYMYDGLRDGSIQENLTKFGENAMRNLTRF